MELKIGGMQGLFYVQLSYYLHRVVTISQYACNRVLKRVLKLSTYRLEIFFVKYEYLQSLQLCEDQGRRGKRKKLVCKHVLTIFATYMETRL